MFRLKKKHWSSVVTKHAVAQRSRMESRLMFSLLPIHQYFTPKADDDEFKNVSIGKKTSRKTAFRFENSFPGRDWSIYIGPSDHWTSCIGHQASKDSSTFEGFVTAHAVLNICTRMLRCGNGRGSTIQSSSSPFKVALWVTRAVIILVTLWWATDWTLAVRAVLRGWVPFSQCWKHP